MEECKSKWRGHIGTEKGRSEKHAVDQGREGQIGAAKCKLEWREVAQRRKALAGTE